MAGTSAVMAAERGFQSPAGGGGQGGAGAAWAGAVMADMAGGPFREPGGGSDLAAEGEGGDRLAAEGFGDRLGYGVRVFGELGAGGCPAALPAGLPVGEVLRGLNGAGVDLEGAGEVVVGGDLDLAAEPA